MTHASTLLVLVLATHTFVSVQALRCWSCSGVTSQANCTAHGHMQSCASNQESCESEIRRNNGQYQITRMCKQRQACENNRKNNVNDCKGPNPVCRYCCTTDLCNKNAGMVGDDKPSPSPVPPSPSPSPVSPRPPPSPVSPRPSPSPVSPRPSPSPVPPRPSPSPVPKSYRCIHIPPPKFGRKTCNFTGFPPEGRIGSKCKFTCNKGYVLQGEMTSFCKKTSPALPPTYNNQVRSCKKAPSPAPRCSALPPSPLNGRRTCSGTGEIGTACEFICNAGFEISGQSRTVCVVRDGRATWEPSTPVCSLRPRCTTLPRKPKNGGLQCPGMGHLDTSCEFSCNTGFVISGSATTTCILKNGKAVWGSETPECNPVRKPQPVCRIPKDPAFRVDCDGNSTTGFTSCQVFCKVGFELKGPSTIKCITRDGRAVWNSQPPYCVSTVVGCAELPPTPDNGQRLCDGDGEVGTRCEYSCDPGSKLFGKSSTECVVINGKAIWEPAVPTCKIIRNLCKVPLDKNVEDWRCRKDSGGNTICEFSCKTGFVAVRETTIHCDHIDGRRVWEANPPYCTIARCATLPPRPQNGRRTCSGTGEIGTACEFICVAGFEISGHSRTHCLVRDGRAIWEFSTPVCTLRPMCNSPEDPAFRGLDCDGDSETGYTSCQLFCRVGFELIGPSTIKCITRDGRAVWNSQPPYCVSAVVGCAEFPPAPDNGQLLCDGDGEIGTRCEYLCDPGLKLFGESSTECLMINGKAIWGSPAPKCEVHKKGPLCKVQLDKNVEDWSCHSDPDGNMVCEFSCTTGFVAVRETTIRCNYVDGTGVWETYPPYCTAAQCPAFTEAPANGRIECTGTGGIGTSCEFSCHPGYQISGSSTITCTTQNGTAVWESSAPSCERTTPLCELPNAKPFTSLKCNGVSNGYASCNISCLAGYESRLSTIHCVKRDGREVWDFDPPQCELIRIGCSKSPPSPDNGRAVCDGDGGVGTRCEYSCGPGLEIFGESVTECVLKNGEAVWESAAPECKIKKGPSCEAPLDKNIEDWDCRSVPGGNTICEFSCRTGFVATRETIIHCDDVAGIGLWKTIQSYCTVAHCPAFTEAPANGGLVCSGTECEFSCHPGYKISGSSTITCTTQNGTAVWESSPPSCERTTPVCEWPKAKTYKSLECHGDSNGYTSCNISCLAGYEPGLSTIHCIKRDGAEIWDLDPPYCKPVSSHCSALPTPVNGGGTCSGNDIGSVCEFYCYTAFTMFGFSTSTCLLQNGIAVWEPATPICRIRHTESACKLPKDAEFTGLNCENDAHEGLSCTFSCRRGFQPRLSSTVDCTVSEGMSVWSSDPPYCTSTINKTTKYEYEIHTFHN